MPKRRARSMSIRLAAVMVAALWMGCGTEDSLPAPTDTTASSPAALTDERDSGVPVSQTTSSSVRWIRKAGEIFRSHVTDSPPPNATRIHAYLALAQYRAVLAARKRRESHGHGGQPSPAGAAAGAAASVLKQFYENDVQLIDDELAAQRAEIGQPAPRHAFNLGVALGTRIAGDVLALAESDNVGVEPLPPQPTGPGFWVSSGAPIVKGGFGARPFFLRSVGEINADPPPEFGSPEFEAALAEVRNLADHRTPEQVEIVEKWVPFSGPLWNLIAADLIEKHHRSEREAARIFAFGNLAAFDAGIGCFESKFTYWYIRPTQADTNITLATPLPNHPSYPSAHSCESGAWQAVLDDAFPNEHQFLNATAKEASGSRILGGLHYRFDAEAGLRLGRTAGRLALKRGLTD